MLLPPVCEADAPLTPLCESGPSHLSPTATIAVRHSATVPEWSAQTRSGPHSQPLRPSECPTLPCMGQSQLLYGLSNTLHHQAVPCLQTQCTHSCLTPAVVTQQLLAGIMLSLALVPLFPCPLANHDLPPLHLTPPPSSILTCYYFFLAQLLTPTWDSCHFRTTTPPGILLFQY